MNERHQIEVKGKENRLTMVGILADNGYTVRITTAKKANSNQKITVVEYWKEDKQ